MKYYKMTNCENKDTILWIHGLTCSVKWFEKEYDFFKSTKYSWIVPILMGYPPSGISKDKDAYIMEQYANDILFLLRKEKITSINIIAHSMGGPIAISLIEQVVSQSNIQINILFYLEGNLDINDAFMSSKIARKSFSDFEKDEKERLKQFWKHPHPKLKETMIEYQKIDRLCIWSSSIDLVQLSETNTLLPRLLDVLNFPTFFLFGEKNKGKYTSETLVLENNLNLLYIPAAGHFPHKESPKEFWRIIFEQIEKINKS